MNVNPSPPRSIVGELEPRKWLEFLPPEWRPWLVYALVAVIVLLVLRALWRVMTGGRRRRGPATIHPKLQKYNIDRAKLAREQREQAVSIVATSTSTRLAGFRIVRQVEAVFVDGYPTPEDALIALKAEAVRRGANSLINVKTDRTGSSQCSASADAVVATPLKTTQPPPIRK